ncbi:hypothetical protein BAZO_10473 [Schinkia azotoformans LMG 9581]|uniref:Uncharacterized protein n=1 Tax=Schinkia azotoformans LMG 9581 TaxID=1131731 RepID=K6C7I8_SCHAZ|nr:hypothetical protein BAZO_10473 [Schinkia azotoformans LMG 9581]
MKNIFITSNLTILYLNLALFVLFTINSLFNLLTNNKMTKKLLIVYSVIQILVIILFIINFSAIFTVLDIKSYVFWLFVFAVVLFLLINLIRTIKKNKA